MAKNKITDLRDHMFAQIEDLRDLDLSEEKNQETLKNEIKTASAIAELGAVIIESAKTEIKFMELTSSDGSGFIPKETKQIGGGN